MSNPIPSALALSTIADGALVTASPHRNNYSAIQAAVNALIVALDGGSSGQFLKATDGTDVVWGNAADKDSASAQIFTGSLSSVHGSGTVGGDGTHPGWLLQESGTSGIFQSVSLSGSNIFLTATIAGNTGGYLFTVTADGTHSWAPAGGAADTTLARFAAAQLLIGPSTNGRGNYVGGGVSNSAGGPATLGIDAAALVNRFNLINASGTFTIGAPANSPGANQAGFFILIIHNSSGGVVTLAQNAVWANTFGTPVNGSAVAYLCVWNQGTSKWVNLGFGAGSGSLSD